MEMKGNNTMKHSFEQFIMNTCKAREWDLRTFLRRVLTNAGFTIQEDDYISDRASMNPNYKSVHNMLAIRGEPKVCLISHTDTCRDHEKINPPDVEPVIKKAMKDGKETRIIQDKFCMNQVGGDDRLGVSINTWIALNTGYDMALLFTTDEEIGNEGADHVNFPELMNYELLAQVDRGNRSDQIVNEIGMTQLCSNQMLNRLIKISEEMGSPRYSVSGMMTDVLSIKRRGKCKEAINMTCGYHNSIGNQRDEYIDINEAKSTMKFVSEIIKYYDLERYKDEPIIKYGDEEKEDRTLANHFTEQEFYDDLEKNRPKSKEEYRSGFDFENDDLEEGDLFSEYMYYQDKIRNY
jgi:hypothetical protein